MNTTDPADDDLVRLYRQANAQDTQRPAPRVDAAILAHARMVAAAGRDLLPHAGSDKPAAASANHSHGLRAMLASVAVIGLMGLLFLQFDRGTPQEKNLAHGTPQTAVTAPVPHTPQAGAGRRDAPLAADAAPVTVAPASAAQLQSPSAQAQAQAQAQAKAEAQLAPATRARESEMVGAGRAESVEAAAPREPMNRTTAALPQAEGRMARQAPVTEQARADLADTSQAAQAKAGQSAPSARREAATLPTVAASDTPLHVLARSGQVEALDVLLATGMAIDTRDTRGRTPLMEAAERGHVEMVRRLLAGGANRQLRDQDAQTAAQLARTAGHPQLAELIDPGS